MSNYNIESLIEENKNLKIKLDEKIMNEVDNINNNNNSNNNIDSNKIEAYGKQINELKRVIVEKDKDDPYIT